ncbi:STAS domain-containing protein [Actinomadura soli]|uniref:Anti-sigma factor antagonist n=1 Tax=Actinomadura soli TaxID=2508997 RepID=A0A5C4J8I4_9ACTN|nr:STAS domain-containing protein [Actinomadura soli]TMQ94980.1 STAS domain-containing protein [Actinomadura soli]
MSEDIRPARRAGRRGPEVRCRTARTTGPSLAAPQFPAAQDPGVAGELEVELAMVRGESAVVVVTGEIDLRTADTLCARLVEARGEGPRRLVVDFSAVAFCDAAGLGALVGAHNRIAVSGGEISLAGVRPAQLRLLRITGLDRLFAVHPDVAAALAEHDSSTTSR